MLNTVTFSVLPNLELAPGALLQIDGLVRSGSTSWPAPKVRSMPGVFDHLVVDQWDSDAGSLILRVKQAPSNVPTVIPAGQVDASQRLSVLDVRCVMLTHLVAVPRPPCSRLR